MPDNSTEILETLSAIHAELIDLNRGVSMLIDRPQVDVAGLQEVLDCILTVLEKRSA